MWRAGVPRSTLALAALLLSAWAATASGQPPAIDYDWQLPRGFPVPAVPGDNPMSAEKVSLGRLLFYEPRLSITGRHACANCHTQSLAFTDGRARAVGATGEPHPRSAMSLANVAYNPAYTWTDPGFASLEAQVLQPLFNEHPIEMGLAGRERIVLATLQSDPVYRQSFARAFPDEPAPFSIGNIARALASFERTLISGRAAFDRYVFDDERAALDSAAKRGMALFYSERIGCAQCHFGINFSGPVGHADAPSAEPPFVNTSAGRFRVPTLRNVTVTAPYMHDGRLATLAAVVAHYAAGGHTPANGPGALNAPKDERLRGFTISESEKADLLAFLDSLTDVEFLRDPRLGPP